MAASNRNYELITSLIEFTVILFNYLKFVERRKYIYFFHLKYSFSSPLDSAALGGRTTPSSPPQL